MKKVLIPTDFSEASRNAAVYAVELLRHTPCDFLLFHAYSVPSSVGVLISVGELLGEEAQEQLQREERFIRERLGYPPIGFDKLALPGTLHELLPDIVSTQHIDMVVMGTQGPNGLADSVLGTHSARVIAQAKCPVLVVPQGWRVQGRRAVVFACDNALDEEEVAGQWFWVDWVVRHFQAKLTVLHIEDPEAVFSDAPPQDPASMEPKASRLPAVVAYENRHRVAYHQDVVEGLLSHVEASEAEMLILVAHSRGWLGRLFHQSVTQAMAKKGIIPLLVLHD